MTTHYWTSLYRAVPNILLSRWTPKAEGIICTQQCTFEYDK